MSSGTNNRTRIGLLPPDIYIPTDTPELFHEVINERERETGIIMNQKEDGIYALEETLSSQTWFSSSPQVERSGFRRVFQTGVLAAGANLIPHGMTINGYTLTRIFGVISDGTVHVPVPNGDGGTGESINIQVDATDITVTITAGYNGFTGNVVLEYVKT